MTNPLPPWATFVDGHSVRLDLAVAVYPQDVILRTAYAFTDRVAVHVDTASDSRISVSLVPLRPEVDVGAVITEFTNALLDFRLRRDIGAETQMIRDLVIAQAFVEADLSSQQ